MAITELKPYLSNIADKLKSLLGITDKINAQDFVEKIDEVYEQGKKSQYDEFWNDFQQNGTRYDYRYAFYGWKEELYNPQFDIRPTNASDMFYNAAIKDIYKNGISIDFSSCGVFTECFRYCSVERLGVLDFRRGTTTSSSAVFAYSSVHTIEELILNDSGSQTFSSWFTSAAKLENITITGKIGKVISFQNSPLLTYESLTSIKNALLNVSATGSTRTITLNATSKAKLSESDIAEITQKGWTVA